MSISDLSESYQDYVYTITGSELSLDEKIDFLGEIPCDNQLKANIIGYVKRQEYFLDQLPTDRREEIRNFLIDKDLDFNLKVAVFETALSDTDLLQECLALLKRWDDLQRRAPAEVNGQRLNRPAVAPKPSPSAVSPKKKAGKRHLSSISVGSAPPRPTSQPITPFTKIPDITNFQFLEKITDETLRDNVKIILLDKNIDQKEKHRMLAMILTKDEQLDCKNSFFNELKKERSLLDQLPEDSRPGVAAILREKSINYMEKVNSLKFMLDNKEHRKKCKEYLSEKVSNDSDVQEAIRNLPGYSSFLRNAPKEMNILILGQTGTGKSTFINGLANYLKFQTMQEARDFKKLEILITSCLTFQDGDEYKKITCEAVDDDRNENLESGQSATKSAKAYVFKWGPAGKEKRIRLIDTPGVGDVAGYERDMKNFENIFTHLANYKELHAICILLKPNEIKLNTTFTYCLGELLSRLHVSAQKNILFCFTNTRTTFYRPGETAVVLKKYLDENEKKRKIEIPMNRSTLFCFDNESFRFLCLWKKQAKFSPEEVKNYTGSWNKSVAETFRFLARVSQLTPHRISDTLAVNKIRMVFNLMTRPLADLQKQQSLKKKVMEELKEEIDVVQGEIRKLNNQTKKQKITTRKKTNEINTVCSKCAIVDQHNVKEIHYKVCHKGCTCVQAQLDTVKDPKIQQCSCIDKDLTNKDSLKCTTCGCVWMLHMQIDYELVTTIGQVTDDITKNRLDSFNSQLNTRQKDMRTAENEKDRIDLNYNGINSFTEEFASFLVQNAILSYNPSKKEYLDQLIKEEQQNVGQGKSDEELIRLQNASDEHHQQVAIIDACQRPCTHSAEELEKCINQLRSKQNNWGPQVDFSKLTPLKVQEKRKKYTEVNLNDGWIGKLEW